jgi:hypothetical protein
MTTNNWWANKMGTPQAAPTSLPPLPPTSPPNPMPYNPVPQPQVPQQMPQSYNNVRTCPNCRSGNYGSMDPNIKARCYDCGYPVVQSGSGTPGIGQQPTGGGAAQPTRQVSTANNFNPQTIIGHI